MPVVAVHRNARSRPRESRLVPIMTEPFALIAVARLSLLPPGRKPRPTIPAVAVHRNASLVLLYPTTTEPSPLTPFAAAPVAPGNTPRSTMPVDAVHRMA